MKNIKQSLLRIVLSLAFFPPLVGVEKTAQEVFGDLFLTQKIYADCNLTTMSTQLNDDFVKAFEHQCECNAVTLNSAYPFITRLTGQDGVPFDRPINPIFYNNLSTIYHYLENSDPALIDFLQTLHMSTPETLMIEHDTHGAELAVEKYSILFEMFFAQSSTHAQKTYSLAAANRIFELCFGVNTFNMCYRAYLNTWQYSILRFFYVGMWKNFSVESWHCWHENCINELKQKAAENKKIIYIHGGYDICQLLRSGIYSFTIIDLFLNQHENAKTEWLIKSDQDNLGIGDKLIFKWEDKTLTLERKSIETADTFSLHTPNEQKLEMMASVTTWTVTNDTQETLGLIKFVRRPLKSADFEYHKNKIILMSFDTLFHTAIPDFLGGYGIDVKNLDPHISLAIKQLRAPVSKEVMLNIRIATLLNLSDLQFISLGNTRS
ncbi:hypothetical protein IPF37_03825 [bacterium]|nr:MAG: hypothetical protein IPF37_03825 [bacterium]